jgi:hypothetical protein
MAVGAGMLWYSDKHPEQATLEGMEVVVLHQQKAWAEAAAKGWNGDITGLPIPNPSSPQITSAEGTHQG